MNFFVFLAYFSGSICMLGVSYICSKICINRCYYTRQNNELEQDNQYQEFSQ